HRIGRTGRIGKDGVAISFATPEQGGLLTDIEMTINKLIPEDRIDGFEAFRPRERRPDPVQPKPLVTATGDLVESEPDEAPPKSQPQRKALFGRPVRRYSSRL